MTATAAVNRYQQRPPAAHNARTIRANRGYVRPEKRKVGSSILPLTRELFKKAFANGNQKRWRLNHSPLFLDFLEGKTDFGCTA